MIFYISQRGSIEKMIDFSCDEDIKNKLSETFDVEYQQLDVNSDIAVFKIELEILYINRGSLSEDICKTLDSLYVKTPFGGFKI